MRFILGDFVNLLKDTIEAKRIKEMGFQDLYVLEQGRS
jgi:hypothetical protein